MSNITKPRKKYHVFLSFRGVDTRNTLVSHLNEALSKRDITTFLDNDELEPGDEIDPNLMQAIEESKIAVVVFSKNYASSAWCLNELLQILEYKVRKNMYVIPIFYRVDPSHVRRQKKTYKDAFDIHTGRYDDNKVSSWRTALKTVANISGHNADESLLDAKLVEAVVLDILKKLDPTSFDDSNLGTLVGIDERVKQVESLLCVDSEEVRIIGLWGMGGMGKTTLARVVYNRIKSHFNARCFLPNIRETIEKRGENYVKDEFFTQLLGKNSQKFTSETLRGLKSLILLDDVDDPRQLQLLDIVKRDNFGPGTKIIITTRDKRVLENVKPYHIYEVEKLSIASALELFKLDTSESNISPSDHAILSKRVVSYAQGNPLAIRVLKSHLSCLSKEEWECELDKLKEVPNNDINAVLKISYDKLDEKNKDVFLDIACLFNGWNKDHVITILNACGLYATSGITFLIEKSLVFIEESNRLEMHDLLQDMGQMIANKLEKPKRIWNHIHVRSVLEENTGNATTRAIVLNINDEVKEIVVRPECFVNMSDLKVLVIYNGIVKYKMRSKSHCLYDAYEEEGETVYYPKKQARYKVQLPQGLNNLPSELRIVHWYGYAYKQLPNFSPRHLVELNLRRSLLERLWNGVQPLGKLKRLDLSYSKFLIEIPDLSEATELEYLDLTECVQLCEAPIPFHKLKKLRNVSVSNCYKLVSFIKSGCSRPAHDELGQSILKEVLVHGTSIERVPKSIGCISHGFVSLYLMKCTKLHSISKGIYKMNYLTKLVISQCPKLQRFPAILEPMPHLKKIIFHKVVIKLLPVSIKNITGLEVLILSKCPSLKSVPKSIQNLDQLKILAIYGCQKFEKPPVLPASLEVLIVMNCKSLKCLELLLSIKGLVLRNCTSMEKILISKKSVTHKIAGNEDRSIEIDTCPKLEDSAMQTILYIATMSGTRLPQLLAIKRSGNKLPKWINHHNFHQAKDIHPSSLFVKMKLPPGWPNKSDFFCPIFFFVLKSVLSRDEGGSDDEGGSYDDFWNCGRGRGRESDDDDHIWKGIVYGNESSDEDRFWWGEFNGGHESVDAEILDEDDNFSEMDFPCVDVLREDDNFREMEFLGVDVLRDSKIECTSIEFKDIENELRPTISIPFRFANILRSANMSGAEEFNLQFTMHDIMNPDGLLENCASCNFKEVAFRFASSEFYIKKCGVFMLTADELKKHKVIGKSESEDEGEEDDDQASSKDGSETLIDDKKDDHKTPNCSTIQPPATGAEVQEVVWEHSTNLEEIKKMVLDVSAKLDSIQDNMNARLQEYHNLQATVDKIHDNMNVREHSTNLEEIKKIVLDVSAKLDSIQDNMNAGFESTKDNCCRITRMEFRKVSKLMLKQKNKVKPRFVCALVCLFIVALMIFIWL